MSPPEAHSPAAAQGDDQLRGKWERADEQLTLLVGAAATDLLGQPPHRVALALAKLMHERYDAQTITGYAAMAITRLAMAKKERLSPKAPNTDPNPEPS